MTRTAMQVGLWSALVATVLNLAFSFLILAIPPEEWHGMQEFVATYRAVQTLPMVPALLLAPTIVALMASVHYWRTGGC